jgi:hypothetical protein
VDETTFVPIAARAPVHGYPSNDKSSTEIHNFNDTGEKDRGAEELTFAPVRDGQVEFVQPDNLLQGMHGYLPDCLSDHKNSSLCTGFEIFLVDFASKLDFAGSPVQQEPSPNGFNEVNKYTSGTEFYGPTATLAFLLELRSRARSFQSQFSQINDHSSGGGFEPRTSRRMSIVNFFHSADPAVSGTKPVKLPLCSLHLTLSDS